MITQDQEFHTTTGFDRYFKTCLWNAKNNKGANITKKAAVVKNKVSLHGNPEVMAMENPDSFKSENSMLLDDLIQLSGETESKIIRMVVNDHTLIKRNGKINISKVADALELPRHEAEKIVKELPFLS